MQKIKVTYRMACEEGIRDSYRTKNWSPPMEDWIELQLSCQKAVSQNPACGSYLGNCLSGRKFLYSHNTTFPLRSCTCGVATFPQCPVRCTEYMLPIMVKQHEINVSCAYYRRRASMTNNSNLSLLTSNMCWHFESSEDIITQFKSQGLHIIRIKY